MPTPTHWTRRAALVLALTCTPALASVVHADTLTFMWDPNDEPDVTGYIVHVGTQSGVYSRTIDVQDTDTYVFPDAAPGQRYYFAVAAYAGALVGALSEEVSGYSNEYPTLADPGHQASAFGASVALQLTGRDPRGDSLRYTAAGLPGGLMISQNLGLISGVAVVPGTFEVTVSVSDGVLSASRSFTWSVGPSAGSTGSTGSAGVARASARQRSDDAVATGTLAVARSTPPGGQADIAPDRSFTGGGARQRPAAAAVGGSAAPIAYAGSGARTRTIAAPAVESASPVVFTGTVALVREPQDAAPEIRTSDRAASDRIRAVAPASAAAAETQALVRQEGQEDGPAEDAVIDDPRLADATGSLATSRPGRDVAAASSAPIVRIETPVDGASLTGTVIFSATAHDADEGDLSSRIVWSSDRDGRLGLGASFHTSLSAGTHVVTASVTGRDGDTGSARVTIVVAPSS